MKRWAGEIRPNESLSNLSSACHRSALCSSNSIGDLSVSSLAVSGASTNRAFLFAELNCLTSFRVPLTVRYKRMNELVNRSERRVQSECNRRGLSAAIICWAGANRPEDLEGVRRLRWLNLSRRRRRALVEGFGVR